MNKTIKSMIVGGISAAMLTASAASFSGPASAAETVRPDGSFDVAQNWHGHRNGYYGRGYHGRNWNGRYYGPPRYRGWRGPGWYGGSYYNDPGAALAAGVIGLAAGAMIGSAINQNRYNNRDSYIAYCSQRYRSFKPSTGTYTGYDGLQHRCVMP